MSPRRRTLWIAVSLLTSCGVGLILVWTAGGTPGTAGPTPPPQLAPGEVPEVDTALFAVG